MTDAPKLTAELRVTRKYHQLYKSLLELVSALNILEPGGTLVDDIVFETNEDGKIRVSYTSTPIQATINTPDRTFILRVIEAKNDNDLSFTRRKIQKKKVDRSI